MTAQVSLDADETRHYELPGSGTPSLMFRFGEDLFVAHAATSDGADFTPGSHHDRVTVEFLRGDLARGTVRTGSSFVVWYGGDVGSGVVIDT